MCVHSVCVCTYTHKDAHAHTRIHATGVRRQARNRNACYRALFTRCDRVLAQVSATPRHPPPAAGNGGVSQFLRKIGVSVPQLRPRRGVSYCSPVDRRFSDGMCQEAASRVLAQLTSSDKGCLKTGAAQRRMTDALNRGTLQHNSHAEQHAASSLAAHEAFAAHRRHVAAQERVGQGAGGEAAGLTRESSLSRRGSASGLRVVPQTPHTRPLSGACSPPRPALPVLPPILAGGEGVSCVAASPD